ncbi:MAG: hypothetical protein K0R81_2315 [Microbacterium sp.]|jgi:hypothetical protein|nr:hypothetical protein [Microbacterium sp.]
MVMVSHTTVESFRGATGNLSSTVRLVQATMSSTTPE